MMCTVGKCGGL